MKTKKIFLVALLLLAVLTIGAVSASESMDELAVEDAGELSVDETPADVVANDGESPEISPDDINIGVDTECDYSTDENNEQGTFGIETPIDVNGTIRISTNGQDFNKDLKNFEGDDKYTDEMEGKVYYTIHPKDVTFLKDLETNDLVSFSFLVEDTPIKISNFKFIKESDDTFRLNSLDEDLNVWSWNEYNGPLYLDHDGSVIDIDVWNQDMTGVFYASVNGTEYKFFTNFDSDDGHARHNWKLNSFDITEPGQYAVVVEYAVDDGSPRVVIHRGVLNVTRFEYDTFRATVDTENHINVFCPDNHEATILIYVKKDGDEDPLQPTINYQIQDADKGNWKSWTFDELRCERENGYEFWVNVTNNGEELFSTQLNSYYGDPWQIEITPEVSIDVWRDYHDYDSEGNILEIYVPEKAQVYNGTIEIKSGDDTVFTKYITVRDMRFDDNSRDYRYGLPVNELDEMLSNVGEDALTFIFKYDDAQVSESFYFITKEDDGFNLEKMYDLGYWNVEFDGPLYLDCNQSVINLDVHCQAMNGIFYVSANGTEYRYSPYFDEGDNAWHNWVLSSFGITDAGLYPFTVEYAADIEFPRVMLLNGELNVTEFNFDAFRATEDRAAQLISIYCPDGSEGAEVTIELKYDWDDDVPYQTVKTLTVSPEHYNKWIEFNFTELGFEWDCDNIVRVNVSKGNVELMHPYVTGIYYDEYYEGFIPHEIIISINNDDFEEGNEEDAFLELYVPETTMFYNGTIEIKSGDIVLIDTTEVSTANMDFNEDGRYYQYSIEFARLNLEDLNNGDILTCTFIYEGTTLTKSFFYLMRDDEDRGEFVQFSLVNFKDANVLRDDVLIEIADFPDGVDDEFEIVLDKWGEKSTYTFNCSELVKDAAGIYTFRCSAFDYAEWMWDMDEVDYEIFVIFNRDGEKEEFNENPRVYKNPEMHHGEITKDAEWGSSVIYFKDIEELRSAFKDEFIVNVTQDGVVIYNLTVDLTDIYDKYAHKNEDDETEYWIGLEDLNITKNGGYGIVVEFTVKDSDEKVQYNSTISVVDFIIDARSNLEQITDAVFRIMLEEEDSGTVAIYVNNTLVFNGTLEDIGYSHWNRMAGYNVPVNYLNITESGKYEIRMEVNSTKGNRTITHNIEMVVGENTIDFRDIIYAYEDNFIVANITSPVPRDSEFVLYLNGKEAGRTRITIDGFEFKDLDKSFTDEFKNLKVGSYDAKIDLLVNGQVNKTYEGSFKVLDRNGTVAVSVPGTLLIIDDAYISFSANMPDIDDKGPLALSICIDPFVNEDGWFDWSDENRLEFRGEELESLLDGKTHKISLGRCLSEGTHKIFVQYVYDEWEQVMDYDFFTGIFAVNVQKVGTKLSGATVKATYNVAKNLVITLKDANNNIIAGKKVTIKVGTISKTLTTNNKGQVVVDISKLVPKTYTATVKFAGDSTYKASSLTVKVVVNKAKPAFTTKQVKVKVKTKTKKIKITLKHNKKGVKGKLVTLKIKGKTYKAKTNKNGVATFKVKKLSKKGKYTGKLRFKGDKYYKAISGKVKVIVK